MALGVFSKKMRKTRRRRTPRVPRFLNSTLLSAFFSITLYNPIHTPIQPLLRVGNIGVLLMKVIGYLEVRGRGRFIVELRFRVRVTGTSIWLIGRVEFRI